MYFLTGHTALKGSIMKEGRIEWKLQATGNVQQGHLHMN